MTTWTIDTVTPALFLAAKEPFQKQIDVALQRHSELQEQLATATVPIRLSDEERLRLGSQYLITTVVMEEYIYSDSSIKEVIDTSTKLLESLDSDLNILGYTAEFTSDRHDHDSYYEIHKFQLQTADFVTKSWENYIINELKSRLSIAIRPEGYHTRLISCTVLKLWLDGAIDNKTLQTIVYEIYKL
jgi:hypothetical protein